MGSAPLSSLSIVLDTIHACLCTLGASRSPRWGSWCLVLLAPGARALPRWAVSTPGFAPPDVPTRQTSSSGRPKSPRIQVVLPEELCERLSALADAESRTVSNMAKVLIQQGVERLERQLAGQLPEATSARPSVARTTLAPAGPSPTPSGSAEIRAELEQRQQQVPRPLRRGPRRVRLQRPIV
jgi:hypothetical protein